MSRVYLPFIFVFILIVVSSCKKKDEKLESLLRENGWTVQSFTSVDYRILRYSDVGGFDFLDNNVGEYTYENVSYGFTWSVNEDVVSIFLTDTENYESPFVFMYYAGFDSFPWWSDASDHIIEYTVKMINNFTLRLRHQDGSDRVDIVLTREK